MILLETWTNTSVILIRLRIVYLLAGIKIICMRDYNGTVSAIVAMIMEVAQPILKSRIQNAIPSVPMGIHLSTAVVDGETAYTKQSFEMKIRNRGYSFF